MVIPGIQDFYDGMNHLVAHEMEQANQDAHPSNISADHSHHDSQPHANIEQNHGSDSSEHALGTSHATPDHSSDNHHAHQSTIQSYLGSIAQGAASAVLSFAAQAVVEGTLSKGAVTGSDSHHQHHHGTDPLSVGIPHGDGFTHQKTGFTCAIVSQKMVLDKFHLIDPRTGKPPSENRLAYDAIANCWVSEEGTDIINLNKLLEYYGVSSHEGHDWSHLIHDLAQGHQVVMAVNADGLWNDHSPISDLMHLFGNAANHSIVVKGLKVDDHGKVVVVINDPGQADGAGVEYSLEHFQSAVDTTHMHYVATDHAPPDWSPGPAIQALCTEQHSSIPSESDAHLSFADTLSTMSDQERAAFLRSL